MLHSLLLVPMLFGAVQPGGQWKRVHADCKRIDLPPLLKHLCYDFSIYFDADVSKGQLIQIRNATGPVAIPPDWASKELSKVELKEIDDQHAARFRLKLKYSSQPQLFLKGHK
ncbi:MAG: hypothetical protein IPL96_08055 [Holophagaceae bacterium]|nr:hypothetical protein [Holophagaceae bacterium]